MHRLYLFIVLYSVLILGAAYGQNLVPNPSFEQTNQCPYLNLPIRPVSQNYPFVQNWSSYNSALYFNRCVDTSLSSPNPYQFSFCTIPNNIFGYRQPHSGNAYAGIMINLLDTLGASFSRCLQAQLISPLEAGQWYCVSFYVSLAVRDSSYANTQGRVTAAKMQQTGLGRIFLPPGQETS